MRIGILGGTFDPIHLGHLQLAQSAKDEHALDKILFIPALIPPHKLSKREITPAPYRFEMVQRAIQGYEGFEASSLELDRADISFTVDTLKKLREIYPKAEFYLIMGADNLKDFDTWKNPDEIRKLVKFLVALRLGEKKLEKNKNVTWLRMPLCPISSSEIRQKISNHESVREMLPESTSHYIEMKKLYQGK